MSKEYLERLADRIFDPTSPDLCEAAEVIRYAAKIDGLYKKTWGYRTRQMLSRLLYGRKHSLPTFGPVDVSVSHAMPVTRTV